MFGVLLFGSTVFVFMKLLHNLNVFQYSMIKMKLRASKRSTEITIRLSHFN